MFYVYVLRSEKTGRRYIGSCKNIEARFHQHNTRQSKATRHGVPWRLLRTEEFATRAQAMRRERYYKSGTGREELERLL
jgi:putative endonuclease